MSDAGETIMGKVENGWRAAAAFPFYTGEVGVRARDGFVELAYFSAPSWRPPRLPVAGTIDGDAYQAVEARRPASRGGAVVLIARPLEELGDDHV